MNSDDKTALSVPMAIIVAGLFIAGAIVISGKTTGSPQAAVGDSLNDRILPEVPRGINLEDITSDDHIRGNLNAKIKIVEYSDTECPFCKVFHETMKKVVDDYGGSGGVAWVYRHFPIDSLHSRARKEAEATECATELGGDEAFWRYIDRIFELTPSNNGLDPSLLGEIATYVGLDKVEFQSCLDSGRYTNKVQASVEDAANAGARGTPYSVIIDASGKKTSLDGALPYEDVKQAIDLLLK